MITYANSTDVAHFLSELTVSMAYENTMGY